MISENLRSMSSSIPDEILSYDEWREHLRKEHNVVVSGKYLAKSIEDRIKVDEAIEIRKECNIGGNTSDGTAEPRILFGTLKTIFGLF